MKSIPNGSPFQQTILLVVGVLMATSVLAVERKTGSSQSPLSWQSVEEVKTAIDRSAALAAARRAIGGLDEDAAPAWIKLAVLTDKHAFVEAFEDRHRSQVRPPLPAEAPASMPPAGQCPHTAPPYGHSLLHVGPVWRNGNIGVDSAPT